MQPIHRPEHLAASGENRPAREAVRIPCADCHQLGDRLLNPLAGDLLCRDLDPVHIGDELRHAVQAVLPLADSLVDPLEIAVALRSDRLIGNLLLALLGADDPNSQKALLAGNGNHLALMNILRQARIHRQQFRRGFIIPLGDAGERLPRHHRVLYGGLTGTLNS